MQRRQFIRNATVASTGLTVLNFPIFGRQAPSNKVVVAVAGVNGRGTALATHFSRLSNVEVGWICDVEDGAIARGLAPFKDASRKPRVTRDIRELVNQKDFDALLVATPDHWHTYAALLGVSHGKHVYVEKPGSHNPHEAELLVRAASQTGKLIQLGNQRRSFPTLQQAVREVQEGAIGKVYFAKAWYNNSRGPIGKGKKQAPPPTLRFDLWQGPAPRKDYQDNLVHYNWHWLWHWGTGETCNNGTHEIDCCRWFLGADHPETVSCVGGRYAGDDDWEAPDTQVATFGFAGGKAITWEGRSCNPYPVEGASRGFMIYGDQGSLLNQGGGDYKLFDKSNKLIKEVKPPEKIEGTNTVSATGNLDVYHFDNFIKAVRGETSLTSPISESYKSVMLCHLANISVRTGSTLHCDPATGRIRDNAAAAALWKRSYADGWDPAKLIHA